MPWLLLRRLLAPLFTELGQDAIREFNSTTTKLAMIAVNFDLGEVRIFGSNSGKQGAVAFLTEFLEGADGDDGEGKEETKQNGAADADTTAEAVNQESIVLRSASFRQRRNVFTKYLSLSSLTGREFLDLVHQGEEEETAGLSGIRSRFGIRSLKVDSTRRRLQVVGSSIAIAKVQSAVQMRVSALRDPDSDSDNEYELHLCL